MNAIEIQGLTKRYGPITAVDGLDLTVRRGSCSPCWGQRRRKDHHHQNAVLPDPARQR